MKFAERLAAHLTPEWRKQYICYESLKKMLYAAQDQAPTAEATEPLVLQRHYASFEEVFFQICEKELTKINTFYAEKLAEAQRRLATLQCELEAVLEGQKEDIITLSGQQRRVFYRSLRHKAQHKTLCDLKLAFSELYLSLILLQNYQNLNFTGFCKIMKKHDKLLRTHRGAEWQLGHVEPSPFHTSNKIDLLIQDVQSLFTNQLEGGDRQKAMKRLRVPPLGAAQSAPVWTTFRVGVQCGLIMALTALISVTVFYISKEVNLWPLLRMYRGGFLLIEFIFLLGINIYGWRKAGVNHILIFELDPRNHLSYQHLFELAGVFGVLWCISLLICLFSVYVSVPIQVNPLAFYGFMLLLLINPVKTFYYKSRVWLLKLLYRVLTAPFHKVGFADFWLADQLNSLSPVFLDLWAILWLYTFEANWWNHSGLNEPPTEKLGYNYGVTCFIQCIPPWIRFVQCLRRYWDSGNTFPHLLNAGKYSTVFIMVIIAALYSNEKERSQFPIGVKVYFYLWIVMACVSTLCTTTWDLKMDWGLFDKNIKENKFLREETVYPKKAYYYCAIAGDILLRISWTMNIIFAQMRHSGRAEIITTVLAPLEVFRRFIWNFFRLENEHLNNCGQFRAVRDISIAPQNTENQAALEQMMDQEDGVKNHGKE
ncbi:solute carrier family 53 member 1-like [Latimeria chalumnae]|uniref:solute carrier family 53 member 1-like n=1 Tax=Latimeria chalumnae TaxID=7897 RepID=UPI00313C0438